MLESIDHINIVVDDLDLMSGFYTKTLGLVPTKRVTISGDWIDETVGLQGVVGDVIYLDLPTGPRIELIRYRSPQGIRPPGMDQPNTHGLRHIALRVRGIEAYVEKLASAGVKFISRVHVVPTAQVMYAGEVRKHIVYFRDPEGNLLELCEYKA